MAHSELPALWTCTTVRLPSESTRQVVTEEKVMRVVPTNSCCWPSPQEMVVSWPICTNFTTAGKPPASDDEEEDDEPEVDEVGAFVPRPGGGRDEVEPLEVDPEDDVFVDGDVRVASRFFRASSSFFRFASSSCFFFSSASRSSYFALALASDPVSSVALGGSAAGGMPVGCSTSTACAPSAA